MSTKAEIEEMFASLEVMPRRTGLSIMTFEPIPDFDFVQSNYSISKPSIPMLVDTKSLTKLDTFCKENFNEPLADITAKVSAVKKSPPITVTLKNPLTVAEQAALRTCFGVTETDGTLTLGTETSTPLKNLRSARAFVLAVMGKEGFLALTKDLVHLTNDPTSLTLGTYNSPDFKAVFKKIIDTKSFYTNKNGKVSNKEYVEFVPVVNQHGSVAEMIDNILVPVKNYVINTVAKNKFFLCPEPTIFVRATHFVNPHDRGKAIALIQKTQFLTGFLEKVFGIKAVVQFGLSPVTSQTFENFVDVYRTIYKTYPTNQVRVFNFKLYKDDFKKSFQTLVGFDAVISQPKPNTTPITINNGVLHSASKKKVAVQVSLPEQPVGSNESIQQGKTETVEPSVCDYSGSSRTGIQKTLVQQDI